jgi:hypothetical protein
MGFSVRPNHKMSHRQDCSVQIPQTTHKISPQTQQDLKFQVTARILSHQDFPVQAHPKKPKLLRNQQAQKYNKEKRQITIAMIVNHMKEK